MSICMSVHRSAYSRKKVCRRTAGPEKMDQKFDVPLSLALETSVEEREKTENLNFGYVEEGRFWELIVKYNGDLERVREIGIQVEYLIAGYAIVTAPEQMVEQLGRFPEIEYIEKPKRYYESQIGPATDSCIAQVVGREPFLSGRGVLVAILDSGIAYEREEFRNPDGTTRIRSLWDQTLGVEYSRAEIDRILREENAKEVMDPQSDMESQNGGLRRIPGLDVSGHGTAVAGIAVGRSGSYTGVATGSELLIVKLGRQEENGFPGTTQIMRGVAYSIEKALEWGMPLVINLSFGNCYGSHNGSSLLERFLDEAAGIGRTVIVVGSGNEGNSDGHFAGNVLRDPVVELAVGEYQRSLSVQIWNHYADQYRITLQAPNGQRQVLATNINSGKYSFLMDRTQILLYRGEPSPYSVYQEIYLEMIPYGDDWITAGVWKFLLEPIRIVTGAYSMYLPSSLVRNVGTGFFYATLEGTLTIPSTAERVITVGAYDSYFDSYADFSGRGGDPFGTGAPENGKPDLVAPGVHILAPYKETGYGGMTGTSFAAPIVSGSVALLMEWGIVNGNDPYLYGEKMKAYLQAGARPLRGIETYPDRRVGFGKLCVAESMGPRI